MSGRAPNRARRLVRGRPALGVGMVLLALALAGCSGGGSRDDVDAATAPAEKPRAGAEAREEAISGSFVGEVSGGRAFVAVVAAPAADGDGSGAVEVYVYDGRKLAERYEGSSSGTGFVARSEDGRRRAKATLADGTLAGTLELRGGMRARFEAGPPSGAAGLYELTVSAGGDVSGTSAAGLGVTGRITDARRGSGTLRLVDGRRVDFDVVRREEAGLVSIRSGEARVIVLAGGRLRGAGESRTAVGDRGTPAFFIRSA